MNDFYHYIRSYRSKDEGERRGNWLLLDTTHLTKETRGLFDRTFWLTYHDYPSNSELGDMLNSLADWIGDQFEDNLVFLRFQTNLEFGGAFPTRTAMTNYINGVGHLNEDQIPDTDGFELRCSERDAVKLLMGWFPK